MRPSDFVPVIATLAVFHLVAALIVALAVVVWQGFRLFRRARAMDDSFTEILRKQEQQRVLLTAGRRVQRSG